VRIADLEESPVEPGPYDTAILFDGLQRSDDPKGLLANVSASLESGGKVLIQVPADKTLYGDTDQAVGHKRRFEREDLEDLVRSAGLELVSLVPFNRLGAWGWRLHHGLGRSSISSAEARGFELLVPLARRLDSLGTGAGLSWLAVARVP
jgi:hypothetical protein